MKRITPPAVKNSTEWVLIGCEKSGIVRDAFLARGVNAVSCDLEPTQNPGPHIVGDIMEIINAGWRAAILHPQCRRVCVSGNHKYAVGKPNHHERLRDARWIERLWNKARRKCGAVCLENSMGVLPTLTNLGKPTQIIQPYEFGDDASKATCLWLYNLLKLTPTKRIPGRFVTWNGKTVERWQNQTDSGQNKLPPSTTRSADRAKTYPGIAAAFADQWRNFDMALVLK